jgi:hypothetical protein
MIAAQMPHWLFRLAAGLCLLLCIAACAAWVQSYRTLTDRTLTKNADRSWLATSYAGCLELSRSRSEIDSQQPQYQISGLHFFRGTNWISVSVPLPNWPQKWKWGGFHLDYDMINHGTNTAGQATIIRSDIIRLPYWFLTLSMLAVPVLWWQQFRRIRRIRWRRDHGLCPDCGYDLRATPNRCPECGHRPQAVQDRTHVRSTA